MKNDNYGVITEQGFVAGKLGFEKITEAEKEKLKEACDKAKARSKQSQ